MIALIVTCYLPVGSFELRLSLRGLTLLLKKLALRVPSELNPDLDVPLLCKHLLLEVFFLLNELALDSREFISFYAVLSVVIKHGGRHFLALCPEASGFDLGLNGPVAALTELLRMALGFLRLHRHH